MIVAGFAVTRLAIDGPAVDGKHDLREPHENG
jgi:hypothetical protein